MELPSEGAATRVLRDHFSTHPTTERRILHLRELARGQRKRPPSGQPEDLVGLFIEIKNNAARLGTEVFTEVVGPLSLDEEWALGARIHRQMIESMEIDPAESARLARLAEPLLRHRTRTQDLPFTITVVQDPQINAVAHLGGYIYVFQGLLDVLDDDVELQFVLAHEIAHVELQHSAKQALPGTLAERAAGAAGKIPAELLNRLINLSYAEEYEFESDAWAYTVLAKEGHSENQILAFFYRLLQIE